MRILSLFRQNSLKPAWTFTTEGNIWRILPAETGEFVAESRDQEKKEVSFFALDGKSGTPLWQNLVLEERWWVGIEDVSNGVLLLHRFASPDLPGHQGIIAIDLLTGKELWSNRELTYWFVRADSILAHKSQFEKRLFFELNLHTGDIIREFDQDSESAIVQMRNEAMRKNQYSLEFPDTVILNTVDPQLAGIVKRKLPANILNGSIEMLQSGGNVVLSYYVHSRESLKEDPHFDNHFKIIDLKNGSTKFSEILFHDARAPVPDSFFVRNNFVYFIKDQKTLTAVRLAS